MNNMKILEAKYASKKNWKSEIFRKSNQRRRWWNAGEAIRILSDKE